MLEANAKDQGHKKIQGQGEGQPYRGQTLSRPRTGMLEAKDQGHNAKVISKKEKVYTLQKFVNFPKNSGILQEKKCLQKVFASSLALSETKQNCHHLGPFSARQKNSAVLESRTGHFRRLAGF